MPISDNFSSIYHQDWEINFLQCTPNGLLRHTELCNLLQLTAGSHAESGGISYMDMQTKDQAWVLSRIRVEIDALPKWGDTVTIKTWIVDLQGSRSVRALEMYLGEKKLASALTFWAVLNTKLRKSEPLALPHEHFEKYPDDVPTEHPFKKIDLSRPSQKVNTRKVVLSDLDIVFHVNNVKYLEWCLDTIDYKPLLRQQLKSFDMNYLRELMPGDEAVLFMGTEENQTYFTIQKADKPSFALELNWK